MYCSTCGAAVAAGRGVCSECGARVAQASPTIVLRSAHTCPRCGYQGEGVSYFSRGSHIAALIALAILTSGIMAAGAIAYYFVRRDHLVCPRCGLDWGKPEAFASGTAVGRPARGEFSGARSETKRSIAGIGLMLFAVLMLGFGLIETEAALVVIGAIAGAGGWLLHRSAGSEREQRRAALLSALQLPVLRLAAEHGGRLTVTQVAAELGWTLPRAEKVLESLNDGYRVSSDITREGVIVYDFLELRHAPPPPALPESGEA
ncbi:MAG TPA: hypothetical protein VFX29_03440 [Longimicrobiaceae bacterium]|jgi:predicted RNA-binding Zn-ribbon protein involved in translation (DUF1610 family)|nr:hypothetical protein [Longimicrobiaceae bacterium]